MVVLGGLLPLLVLAAVAYGLSRIVSAQRGAGRARWGGRAGARR